MNCLTTATAQRLPCRSHSCPQREMVRNACGSSLTKKRQSKPAGGWSSNPRSCGCKLEQFGPRLYSFSHGFSSGLSTVLYMLKYVAWFNIRANPGVRRYKEPYSSITYPIKGLVMPGYTPTAASSTGKLRSTEEQKLAVCGQALRADIDPWRCT